MARPSSSVVSVATVSPLDLRMISNTNPTPGLEMTDSYGSFLSCSIVLAISILPLMTWSLQVVQKVEGVLSPENFSSTLLQLLLSRYPSGGVTSQTLSVVPTGYFLDLALLPFVVIVSKTLPEASFTSNTAPLNVASPCALVPVSISCFSTSISA